MSLSSKARVGFRAADSASRTAYTVAQDWLYLENVEEARETYAQALVLWEPVLRLS